MILPRSSLTTLFSGPALFAFALCSVSIAKADEFSGLEPSAPERAADYQSPQHFALELKGGLYSPNIDSTKGLTGTPFADLFNNQYTAKPGQRPAGQPLFGIEFDYQFWHPFGSFAVGVSASLQDRSTHSFEFNPPDANGVRTSCVVPMCVRSGDTTTLIVIPLTLELIYRFDVLAVRYKVPIVPYVKGGLGYYAWFIEKGDGSLTATLPDASGNTKTAFGGTLGLVFHPGVALMLDILDPTAARTLDAELGINHTYLFGEMSLANIDGLGFANKMNLSDLSWNAGVAFEF